MSDPSSSAPHNKLWLRAWDLVIGSGADSGPIDVGHSTASKTQQGKALSLSDFRFTFEVEMNPSLMPWRMTATVYNLSDNLMKRIAQQYTNVALIAGYALPNYKGSAPSGYHPGGSMLFSGDIIWFERGRESATDTFLRIYANNFDPALNSAVINTTLPAGHTQNDVLKACADAMSAAQGSVSSGKVTLGQITDLGDAKSPRARTLLGSPRDVVRDVTQTAGGYCYIDGSGKLNLQTLNDPPPQTITVVNSQTGMIGIPHQNMDGGISVMTLLNPSIQPGSAIHINESDLTRKMLSQSGKGQATDTVPVIQQQMMIANSDGVFRVWSVKHHGDTRGNPWYSEIITRAANPASQKPGVG